MSQLDLAALLAKSPRDCWIALNEEQNAVVGRGESIGEAVKEANGNGVNDPIVIWSPKAWNPSVFRGA